MVIESFCKARLRRGGFGVVGKNGVLLNRCSAFILNFLEKRKKRQLSWKKQKKTKRGNDLLFRLKRKRRYTLHFLSARFRILVCGRW